MNKIDELSEIIACMLESQDAVWCDDALVFVQHALDKGYAEYVALCCNADNSPQGWRNMKLRSNDPLHELRLPNDYMEVSNDKRT